jgi:hypothetical protein
MVPLISRATTLKQPVNQFSRGQFKFVKEVGAAAEFCMTLYLQPSELITGASSILVEHHDRLQGVIMEIFTN